MYEILGEYYYIDFEKLDSLLIIDDGDDGESTETIQQFDDKHNLLGYSVKLITNNKIKEINGARYDIIRTFIDEINGDVIETDSLGRMKIDDSNIKFKLAFNTLLYYNILKKYK